MKIEKFIIVMSILILTLLFFNIQICNRPELGELQPIYDGFSSRDLYVELPDDIDRPVEKSPILEHLSKYKLVRTVVTEMELTELGTYYITSYCPAECGGSWSTASGATCHRAEYENRYTEPTTCAIDRRYHSFGEEFYIEEFDRTFVAEDTGSGVKGNHLDLFYEDYEDVLSFPTGYYTVYAVEWVEVEHYSWELIEE